MGVTRLGVLAAGALATLSVGFLVACGSSESASATTGSDAGSCGQGEVYCTACGGWFCGQGGCPSVTCLDAGAADATNGDAGACATGQVSCLDCSGGLFCTSRGCPEINCPARDASTTTDDAGTRDGPSGEARATVCGPAGSTCNLGEVCVDRMFSGINPPNPDGAPPPAPSESYSCLADPCPVGSCTSWPCGNDASTECYCTLCGGLECGVAKLPIVTCTYQPICASSDTPIATANGDRPIASLRVGDLVYSADRQSLRLVPLLRVSRTAVSHHHVIEIILANGSELKMSAGHPTADGRLFGDLQAADRLDGVTVLSRREIAYADSYTYDILPASDTHTYVAAGVLVGTTLGAAPFPPALLSP
jgi:hypothetical protein